MNAAFQFRAKHVNLCKNVIHNQTPSHREMWYKVTRPCHKQFVPAWDVACSLMWVRHVLCVIAICPCLNVKPTVVYSSNGLGLQTPHHHHHPHPTVPHHTTPPSHTTPHHTTPPLYAHPLKRKSLILLFHEFLRTVRHSFYIHCVLIFWPTSSFRWNLFCIPSPNSFRPP